MVNKKIWCAVLLSAVMIVGAGCGQKAKTAPPPPASASEPSSLQADESTSPPVTEGTAPDDSTAGSNSGNDSSGGTGETKGESTGEAAKDQPSFQKLTIDVYYTDPQEMELKKAQKEISYQVPLEKYVEAFKALQDSGSTDLVPLWGKIELTKMSLDKDTGLLHMDIHIPDEARLGSGGEQFALDSLKQTMFQFDEIKAIDILVDGQAVESLMGHMDLDHPIKRGE
ncbi:GerMN domain-containing protein [Paenibacillus favisporus]|uniref:GerMN domain-containing protein n=1 Tax=Paenibacillus favisporus TaxID=221028 RepID=UPI003D2DE8A8